MRLLAAALVLSALAPAPARPDDQRFEGFALGARLGYALPLGQSTKATDLSKDFAGNVPLGIDVGYRFNRRLEAGAYAQYAWAMVAAEACPAGASCSGSVIRLGVEGVFRFWPGSRVEPYAGLGTGYEWARASVTGGGQTGDATFRGWEFVHVQLGGDVAVDARWAVGPYVTFALGRYTSASASSGGVSVSRDVPGDLRTTHGWVQLGVRGAFRL